MDLARFFYLLARPSPDAETFPFRGMPSDTRCPVCGTTYADLDHTGLLGCAACYETFAPAVAQTLWTLQGVAVNSDIAG
jgi:hypothetical protein